MLRWLVLVHLTRITMMWHVILWVYPSIHSPLSSSFFLCRSIPFDSIGGWIAAINIAEQLFDDELVHNLEIRPPLDFIFQIFQSFGNPVELALCQHAIVQWKGRRTASLPGNGWIIAARGEGGRVVRFEIYKRVRNKYAFDKWWFIIESGDTPGELPFSVITFIKIIIKFLSDYRWRWNV